MEAGKENALVLEGVIQALEEEKIELQTKLDTETDAELREEITKRLTEIDSSLQTQSVVSQEPTFQPEELNTQPEQSRRSERDRKPTERWLAYAKDESAKKERKFMLTYVSFKGEVQYTRSKLKEECDKEELEGMITTLEEYESHLKQVYESLRSLTTPSQDIRRRMDSCTSVTKEVVALLKMRCSEVGKEFDAVAVKQSLSKLLQRDEARSIYGSTVSRVGADSIAESQVSIKRAEAAARLASKRAEINRECEIAAQRKEVFEQQEKLKMLESRDLEAMQAEYDVYAEEEMKMNAEIGEKKEITLPPSQPQGEKKEVTLPPNNLQTWHNTAPYAQIPQGTSGTPHSEKQSEQKLSEPLLVQAFKDSLTITRLPAPEPSVFTGDPLKFTEWRTSFKALIETSCTNSAHRLFYLRKYISGDALSVLEGTFYRSDDEAYTQAWDALNKRYGHPFIVQRAFRGKLSSWPKIGPKEPLKLRDFSDFLVSCKNAMPHISGLKVLDDCEENQRLLQKLPDWATARWNRIVTKELDDGKPYPSFEQFSNFLAEEARIACNPVSSLHALKRIEEKAGTEVKRIKARTLVTTTKVAEGKGHPAKDSGESAGLTVDPSAPQTKWQIKCICCQKNHFIYKCERFAALTLDDKKAFIKTNNMCFACLRVGHVAKDCRKRATCNVCRKSHPTPLHDKPAPEEKLEAGQQQDSSSTTLCSVNMTTSDRTSMIVPVWLSSDVKISQEILVYALLDTQSSNTFISEDVCGQLEAHTEPVKLRLSTMTGRSIVNCHRASGLKVRGYSSKECIELPPVYTREDIPLEKTSIPTKETAKAWTHLLSVADEMPDLLGCPAGLLIGYDCVRALKPKEVVSGAEHEPYAVKTHLGWSVVGARTPATGALTNAGFCYRISVKEIPPITPACAIKALERDFQDTNPTDGTISQEDIQFLQILNEGIHYNDYGHLEMPLPFRERPQLPNNKHLATVRLKYLKGKMDKNPKYKSDYVQFMVNVFNDGDAEEVHATPEVGNTWYIPHHGVYHPRKPEKIRVVFDCSAKYEGTALNDHLLTGPDLTNALTGVLCRFRQYPIAINCDVEKMFHRFHVTPEDRDFMRFLWWENGNTMTEPKEYRMHARMCKLRHEIPRHQV